MNKIPVGKTIAYAYVFTFTNLGAIIGLIWIPMLIVTVVGFLAQSTYVDGLMTFTASKNPTDLMRGFMWMMLFVFVALLGNAIMLVPVMQQALGKRQGHAVAHFALGAPEWRMLGAYLALLGIVLAIVFAAALVEAVALQGLAMTASGALASPGVMAGLALLGALLGIAFLAVLLRLAFFIPAVTLLEEKIDLTRGWMLAKGNTWRIVAIVLALVLPVAILYFGLELAVFGPDAVLPQLSGAKTGMPTMEELQEARHQMPITEALGFLLAPLTIGLNAGMVAAAYRALTSPSVQNP
jgi:hypothetical protein